MSSESPASHVRTRILIPGLLPFVMAGALALTVSLLELAVRYAVFRFTIRPLETGAHIVWMTPVMNLIWFELAAVVLWVASRALPRLVGAGVIAATLSFLAILSLFWLHTRLHWIAMAVLALGLAAQVGRFASRRGPGTFRFSRKLLLVSSLMTLILAAGVLGRRYGREWIAIRSLGDAPAGKPNVLLLVLDTVRSFSLSVYGYEQATTPNLEELAREGVRFDRAFATSGWTLPSHASMFTGRYADELRTGPGMPLPKGVPTLAEAMTNAGYATAGFVANLKYTTWEHGVSRGFIHYEDYPLTLLTLLNASSLSRRVFMAQSVRRAVGYYDDPDRKNAARIREDFVHWLDELDSERPFFAFLNFFDAHHAYLPPSPYDTLFGPKLPPVYRPYPPEFGQLSQEEMARASNGYHGAIAYLDAQIGMLMEELRTRGLLDNTVVIITSDHGEHLGDHNLLNHGNSFYRQLLQVPLIIRYPSALPSNARVRTPVSLRDLPATILQLANVDSEVGFPGVSLVPAVEDSSAERSPIVSGRAVVPSADGQSLVSDGMHYIRLKNGSEELYDLEHDSLELKSLIDSTLAHPSVTALRARLDSVSATTQKLE